MRQAHPNSTGYAPVGQQPAYQHGYGAPYQDATYSDPGGNASFQRIDGLRNALASIEQRIGGMAPGFTGQNPQQFQAPHNAPYMQPAVAPHAGPYAQPYPAPQQQTETMQQQLNRLATQVGQANTAMRRPPAAPARPQGQPQQMQPQPAHMQQSSIDLSAITNHMNDLRQELASLKEEVAKPVSVKTSVAQEEVDRIASAIAALQSKDRIDPQAFNRLTSELDGLRSSMKSDMEDTVRRTIEARAGHEADTARAVSQKLDHIAHGLAAAQKAALEAAADDGHVANRIDELARQMEQLALHTATYGESHGEDVARQTDLARRIDELTNQFSSSNTDRADDMARRMDELAQQVASNGSILTTSLTSRIDDLTHQVTASGSSRTDELSERIDALRSSVGELPQTLAPQSQAIGRLEETLDAVTRKIEQLAEATAASTSAQSSLLDQVSQRETLSQEDLSQIEGRLDEIARAVVAVSNISREAPHIEMPEIDLSGMDRIEARMAELARTVDEIATVAHAEPQRDPALDDIAVRIEGLTDRLGSFEKYARAGDLGGASAMFSAPDTGQIEEQLRNLTARVEEASAANSTGAQMASLEAQVAQMMAMLDRAPQQVAAGEVDFTPLEQRLAGIESHLQQAPNITVNAAQEAARQAIAMVGENSEQGQIVAALSDHLTQLQRMAETGNAGTGQLQETLQAVMGRLDAIEHSVERVNDSRNSVPYGAAAPMPSANQLHDAPITDRHAHEHRMAAQAEQTFAAADTLLDVAESDQRHAGSHAFVNAPSVDPTDHIEGLPPLDAGDGVEDHAPLEPNGSHDPLASFAASHGLAPSPASDGARPNAVAAARRALQATSAEMTATRTTPIDPGKDRKGKKAGAKSGNSLDGLKDKLAALASKSNSETIEAGSGKDNTAKYRKPVMIAAAAVLLALVAFQGIQMFGGSDDGTDMATIEMSVDESGTAVADAEPMVAGDDRVVVREIEPVETDASGETVTVTPAGPSETFTFGGETVDEPATDTLSERLAEDDAPETIEPRASVEIAAEEPVDTFAVEQPEPVAPVAAYDVPRTAGSDALVAAASAGEPKALFEVGMRYSNGRGVTRDMVKAGTWFKAAADQGFAPAQYSYGSLLEKGIGVERDVAAAAGWYEQAAAQGNARAMHNLAVINAMGNPPEVQPDMDRAVEWFKQAAEFGIKDSQFNLGILYGQGMGVPQNLEEAYKWFAIAAKTGDTDAAAKRDEVAEAMGQVISTAPLRSPTAGRPSRSRKPPTA